MELMKAATAKSLSDIRLPCAVSPKLDGIRAVVRGSQFWSRQGKLIPNHHIQKFAHFLPDGFEGELVATREDKIADYSTTASQVMAVGPVQSFRFYIFDICRPDMEFLPFSKRVLEIRQTCLDLAEVTGVEFDGVIKTWALPMPNMMAENIEQLSLYYQKFSSQYEGIIARDPNGRYKRGRSTLKKQELVKLKPTMDTEALCIGYVEEKESVTERPKGRLGALICESSGVKFQVGTGFSAQDREDLWDTREALVGKPVTITYQEIGAKGAPRFPVFKAFRND